MATRLPSCLSGMIVCGTLNPIFYFYPNLNESILMRLLLLPIILVAPWIVINPVKGAEAESIVKKTLRAGEPTEADLQRARTVLSAWENEDSQKSPRVMRIVYWSPADREPQPEFRARLTRVMQDIQEFYRREMASWGFIGRSIQLELAEDGLLKIYEVQGKLKSEECSEADSKDGQEIRRDSLRALRDAGVNGDKETMVIFCNLADWDPVKRTMSHHSPYYASGDNRGGTAWQVDSPLLDSASLSMEDQQLVDRQYGKISLGKYNSIFVGGVCHELGHALGLPHCKESGAERTVRGTSLMGGGNRTYGDDLRGEGRGSFLTLPDALKLAGHPQFSGSIKQIETRASATFSELKLSPNAEGLQVSGHVQANLPVHAVLAYADPEGGSDYDSEIAAAVPQENGRFTLQLPRSPKKDIRAALHFVAVCANGAATASVWSAQSYTLQSRIKADSSYDVSKAMEKLELDQHLVAFREGKLTPAAMTELSSPLQALLKRLSTPDNATGKPTPSAVPETIKMLPLSDVAPLTAKTGWGGVHYDRTNDGNPLIGPDGVLAHGLYAHADSVYEYDLGGKWKTLTGVGCVLDGAHGSVEATILGDEKQLWKSGPLKPGDSKPFTVEVTGIKTLKLEIKGVKGNSGAWGAWGEPILSR
ncbi:MAG: hypothetical protein JWP89_1990 [Schlesneria sp.]|nr:hypothetical protein [Schlesneria sp.]